MSHDLSPLGFRKTPFTRDGEFPVDATGPALVYLAEDALPRVRDRVSHLCRHRGLDLARLDLQVVTADRLRLDTERDQLALDQTVQRIRPALLLLDPLVRLHSLDENSASDISSLLGFLRAINRRHQLALVLVHHMAKRSSCNLGQSLRGSSDLHAWTDSACYLVRRPDDRLQLTVEHRSAPAPDPLLLRLSGGGDQPLSLLVDSADAPPPPLPVISRRNGRISGRIASSESNRSESEAASILWTVRRVLYSVRTDRRSPPVHRRRGIATLPCQPPRQRRTRWRAAAGSVRVPRESGRHGPEPRPAAPLSATAWFRSRSRWPPTPGPRVDRDHAELLDFVDGDDAGYHPGQQCDDH